MEKDKKTNKSWFNRFITKVKTLRKREYLLIGFYLIILLSIINVSVMLIHFLDKDYEYPIFSYSYIDAISPDQDVNDTMYTDVIRIQNINLSEISEGDKVVIFGDFGINERWVEDVVNVDYATREIEVTYDQISTQTVQFDSIYGEYVKDANIFGTMYFTAKFNQGFLLLFMSHAFIISAYYFAFIDTDKKHKQRVMV